MIREFFYVNDTFSVNKLINAKNKQVSFNLIAFTIIENTIAKYHSQCWI